jgi:hypothetical protein
MSDLSVATTSINYKIAQYIDKYKTTKLNLTSMCAEFVNDLRELHDLPEFHTKNGLWKRSINRHMKQFLTMYYYPDKEIPYSPLNRVKLKLNEFQPDTLAIYILNIFQSLSREKQYFTSMNAFNIDHLISRLKNVILHL